MHQTQVWGRQQVGMGIALEALICRYRKYDQASQRWEITLENWRLHAVAYTRFNYKKLVYKKLGFKEVKRLRN